MTQVNLNHAFISLKSDSPDDTLVSASEWNDELLLSNGANGQLVARDSASPTGGTYVDGAQVSIASSSYAGSSPSPVLATVNVTFNSNGALVVTLNAAIITSDSSTPTVRIYRNSIQQATPVFSGNGVWNSYTTVFNEVPGTYSYNAQIIAAGAATIVSSTTQLSVLKLGKV